MAQPPVNVTTVLSLANLGVPPEQIGFRCVEATIRERGTGEREGTECGGRETRFGGATPPCAGPPALPTARARAEGGM